VPALDSCVESPAGWYEPLAQEAVERLEERRLQALEERLQADLALGRNAELVPDLEALVREHPFRERLFGQLMLALYQHSRIPRTASPARIARSLLPGRCGSARLVNQTLASTTASVVAVQQRALAASRMQASSVWCTSASQHR
jgi:hypothetical protein